MMKKRLLTILLTCSMLLTLCGCGSASSTGPASLAPTPDPVPASTPAVSTPPESTPESVPAESVVEEPETEPEPEEIAGLIVLRTYAPASEHGMLQDLELLCIDPATGASRTISQFNLASDEPGVYTYEASNMLTGIVYPGIYDNHQEWFSADCDKMAVTKYFQSGGQEAHAGWMDQSGEFFDVTEALGLVSSGDFADPAYHIALGFCDNYFVFYEPRPNMNEDVFHYVPVDDPRVENLVDGSPFPNGMVRRHDRHVTEWLDGTTFLANLGQPIHFAIWDTSLGNETRILESKTRTTWNAIMSPDGTQIAFTSSSGGVEPSELFIMSFGGGDPTKVPCDIGFTYYESAKDLVVRNSGMGATTYPECNILLDWR